MLAALAFIRSPLGRYALLGLAAALILWGVVNGLESRGAAKVEARYAARDQAAQADVQKHTEAAAKISSDAKAKLSARQAQIHKQFAPIIAQAKNAPQDPGCRPSPDWISLWNAFSSAGDQAGVASKPG